MTPIKQTDHVAFEWKYGVDDGGEIVVSNIATMNDTQVLCHLAICNPNGTHRIKDWRGHFDILKPDHPLILKDAYEAK